MGKNKALTRPATLDASVEFAFWNLPSNAKHRLLENACTLSLDLFKDQLAALALGPARDDLVLHLHVAVHLAGQGGAVLRVDLAQEEFHLGDGEAGTC